MEDYKETIAVCRKQLSDLGYHSFQIDRIIKEAVGIGSLKNLTREQGLQVVETLVEYLKFAIKCQNPD